MVTLPAPGQVGEHDFESWNYFVPTAGFFATRNKRVQTVVDAVEALLSGSQPHGKVISTRYTEGLPHVDPASLEHLRAHLDRFRPLSDPTP